LKLYLQWAKATPEDWFPVDISRVAQVRNLPKKGIPTASSVLDNTPGWLCGLNVQGIDFSGYDHTAVEVVGDGLRITGWQDDTEDFGDTRWATEWTLMPPAPDPALGGRMNTVQSRRIWATPDAAVWFPGVDVLPWSEFTPPATNLTLHGVWMSNDLYAAHQAVRTHRGWREWLP
jgi:hypothetical protein